MRKKEKKKKRKKEEEDDVDMCRLSNRALECDINKAIHMGSGGTWQWSFLEAFVYKYPNTFVYL